MARHIYPTTNQVIPLWVWCSTISLYPSMLLMHHSISSTVDRCFVIGPSWSVIVWSVIVDLSWKWWWIVLQNNRQPVQEPEPQCPQHPMSCMLCKPLCITLYLAHTLFFFLRDLGRSSGDTGEDGKQNISTLNLTERYVNILKLLLPFPSLKRWWWVWWWREERRYEDKLDVDFPRSYQSLKLELTWTCSFAC